MLSSTLTTLALVPLALSLPLWKRQATDDAAQVLTQIETLTDDITTLNTTLNGFPVSQSKAQSRDARECSNAFNDLMD